MKKTQNAFANLLGSVPAISQSEQEKLNGGFTVLLHDSQNPLISDLTSGINNFICPCGTNAQCKGVCSTPVDPRSL